MQYCAPNATSTSSAVVLCRVITPVHRQTRRSPSTSKTHDERPLPCPYRCCSARAANPSPHPDPCPSFSPLCVHHRPPPVSARRAFSHLRHMIRVANDWDRRHPRTLPPPAPRTKKASQCAWASSDAGSCAPRPLLRGLFHFSCSSHAEIRCFSPVHQRRTRAFETTSRYVRAHGRTPVSINTHYICM